MTCLWQFTSEIEAYGCGQDFWDLQDFKHYFFNKKEFIMVKAVAKIFVFFTLASVMFFGCSSDSGNSGAEEKEKSAGKTEDGHDVLVFQEGELDNILARIDTTSMSEEGFYGTLIFKDMKPEDIPSVGDIIASPITDNAPHGFLYKVQGVSTTDGITAAVVRSASLEEAIENVDFQSETEFEFDEDGNLLRMLMKSGSGSAPLKLTKEIVFVQNDNIEGKLKADVNYVFTFVFNIEIKGWIVQSTKMTLKQDGRGTLNGSVKGQVEKTIKKELGRNKLPDITFWIPIPPLGIPVIPVVITNDLIYNLKIAGKAETGLEVTYTLNTSGEYGFEYKNGTYNKISQSSLAHSFDYEQYMSGEIRTGLIAALETRLYGIVGLALDAGPTLKLSVEGQPIGVYVFENGFDSEKNGVSLDFGMDFGARMTLGMLSANLPNNLFPEGWTMSQSLYKASFLPSFDEPQISISESNVAIKSGIRRDKLNYPVKSYGFCLEKTANECRNGGGIKRVLGEGVRSGEYREATATFSGIEEESYSIRPYFENGVGGIYYDKAVNVVQGVVQSSSSSSGTLNSSSSSAIIVGTFTDSREGKSYGTVVIGNQTWMAENLNYNASGSKCYDDDPANCDKYGRLYNWERALTACPSGWHLPTDEEWTMLINNVGFQPGRKLKAKSGWNWYSGAGGTDLYGFTALPGGHCNSDGTFGGVEGGGNWWSATEYGADQALYRHMNYGGVDVYKPNSEKTALFSVRCIKDSTL
jgi:uncharacterized protein (TIGR02145 family)